MIEKNRKIVSTEVSQDVESLMDNPQNELDENQSHPAQRTPPLENASLSPPTSPPNLNEDPRSDYNSSGIFSNDENPDQNLELEDISENHSFTDCLSCSYKDNSIDVLTRKVQEYRNQEIEFTCKYCSGAFGDLDELQDHFQNCIKFFELIGHKQ